MHKRARSWGNWLTLAIILSAVIGAAFWIGRAEEKPSGREELKIEVAELRSQAGVGQLLAEQAANGKVTSVFLREQASQLQKNVEAMHKKLDPSQFEPGVRDASARAGELSARLGEDVRALGGAYGNTQAAGALKEEFANLFSQLMSLENSLKS
jgi:paraquat-inducible protein B